MARPPNRREAVRLMDEAGCGKGIIDHCTKVAAVAARLANAFRRRGFAVDLSLVEAGALMHDIGRSRTHGVGHGAVGGDLARSLGIPEALARVIERHVGAGITAEEAARIGLPRRSYVPETLEEKIVSYADKLVEGMREVELEATAEKFAAELGTNHPAVERLRALHDEMVALVGPRF